MSTEVESEVGAEGREGGAIAHHVRDTLGHAGPCGRQQLHLTEDQLHLPLGPHLGFVVLGLKEHRITHPNGKEWITVGFLLRVHEGQRHVCPP